MDTRRTTLIATIIVIALLAVGIGYAYTAYTENSGNTSNVAYLKLTQTGDTGYTFADGTTPVQFDTFNEINTSTIYYAIKNPVTVENDQLTNDYICASLGSIKLQADFERSSSSITVPETINVDVADSKEFDSDGTWVFFITNESHDEIYAYKNTHKHVNDEGTDAWIDGPDALTLAVGSTGAVTIEVLVGFDSTITPAKTVGEEDFYEFSRNMATPLLNGASIIFSAKDVGTSGEIDEPTHTDLDASALSAKTVTLKPGNGGSGADVVIKYIGEYKLPKCTFTAPGVKTFSKWQIGDDQYDAGATVTITQDTTITAIWA